MRPLVAALCASVLIAPAAITQPPLPQPDVQRVQRYFEGMRSARYMENGSCTPTTYPGWESFPLQRCEYSVRDRGGRRKTAVVIMLNASPEQLARWVVFACREARGTTGASCTRRLGRQITGQSGAQFPVAGIVYEDILPADGIHEAYVFRHGVTVGVEGFPHRLTRQATPREIDAALNGRVQWSGRYARVQSTTREDYRAAGGTADVGTSTNRKLAWLDVVRADYQAAWGADRNGLMIAWARRHL
jgi:hypothetical protein